MPGSTRGHLHWRLLAKSLHIIFAETGQSDSIPLGWEGEDMKV